MVKMALPMQDGATIPDLEARSGQLTQLAQDAAGLFTLSGAVRTLALRTVLPERFRKDANSL